MEGIQVSVEKAGSRNNIAIIKVGGYIDTTTSAELEHSLDTLLKSDTHNIVIDLGNVDYISSAGWGIFISEIKGIREKGGDLKLVKMVPDVYEVFELLEFHYILRAFDTIDEAISDFDRGGAGAAVTPRPVVAKPEPTNSSNAGAAVSTAKPRVERIAAPGGDRAPRTLDDKVRQVVLENPEAGPFKIKQMLASSRHGNTEVGWFEVRRILKKLNLDSREKRIDFFKKRSFN
jgi:anti-sigma B factor antagonist